MVQVKLLEESNFKKLLSLFSFESIDESPAYQGWLQRISRCSENDTAYLIEYINNKRSWLSFIVSADREDIPTMKVGPIPQQTVDHVTNGAVLKLWLQLQRKFCLHASGVRIGDEVILFIGPKGAGKSTTAAYFNSRGYFVWCDDYCVLEDRNGIFFAYQGDSQLKLKFDAVQALSLEAKHLKNLFETLPEIESQTGRVHHYKSYYRNAASLENTMETLPVAKVILLLPRVDNKTDSILSLSTGIRSFKAVMDEIMLREVVSKDYLAFYFEQTRKLVENVKFYQLQAPNDLSQMHLIFEALLADHKNE